MLADQKPLIIENYTIINKRNVLTRGITTSVTQQVLLFCDYYTWGRIRAYVRSPSTDLCGVDLKLTQARVQHNTLNNTDEKH